MKVILSIISLVFGAERGPRPTNVLEVINSTVDNDYTEVDIAGTFMDIFESSRLGSNATNDPGDKIRVLSNIVRIQLDDNFHDELSNSVTNMRTEDRNSSCIQKTIVVTPIYSKVQFFLSVFTFIITLTTFISSLVLIYKTEILKRRNIYIRAENSYPQERVSFTSSGE